MKPTTLGLVVCTTIAISAIIGLLVGVPAGVGLIKAAAVITSIMFFVILVVDLKTRLAKAWPIRVNAVLATVAAVLWAALFFTAGGAPVFWATLLLAAAAAAHWYFLLRG